MAEMRAAVGDEIPRRFVEGGQNSERVLAINGCVRRTE
jgi:uncharacterized metal-binding protein